MDRWHDEGRIFHLLKDDGSPACGVKYYTSGGAYPGENLTPKCRRCTGIAKKRQKKG